METPPRIARSRDRRSRFATLQEAAFFLALFLSPERYLLVTSKPPKINRRGARVVYFQRRIRFSRQSFLPAQIFYKIQKYFKQTKHFA
jgi:hypothetical protein